MNNTVCFWVVFDFGFSVLLLLKDVLNDEEFESKTARNNWGGEVRRGRRGLRAGGGGGGGGAERRW